MVRLRAALKVLLTADLLRDAMALPFDEPDETLNHRLWWSAVYYANRIDDRIKRRRGTLPGIPASRLVDSTKAGSDGYYVHQVLAQKGNYVFGLEYHTETAGPLQSTECRQSHTASECQLGDMPRVRVTTAHRHFRSHYGNWPFHGHMWVARGNWSN